MKKTVSHNSPVVAHLSCQPDLIWKKLKPKLLGMPLRDSLDQITEGCYTLPKSGPRHLCSAHIERTEK